MANAIRVFYDAPRWWQWRWRWRKSASYPPSWQSGSSSWNIIETMEQAAVDDDVPHNENDDDSGAQGGVA